MHTAHQFTISGVFWDALLQHKQLTDSRAAAGAPHGGQVQLGHPLRPCRPLLAAPLLSLSGLLQDVGISDQLSSNRPHWFHRAEGMHAIGIV